MDAMIAASINLKGQLDHGRKWLEKMKAFLCIGYDIAFLREPCNQSCTIEITEKFILQLSICNNIQCINIKISHKGSYFYR